MNKLQIVSVLCLLAGISAQAQTLSQSVAQNGVIGQVTFEYQCQQDPKIMGMGTKLTVSYAEVSTQDPFVATLVRTLVVPNPQITTQTFNKLSRHETPDFSAVIYSGEEFNLTISEDVVNNNQIGRVFPATMTFTDSQGTVETQKLFCKQGDAPGLPAVSGSN